MGGLALVLLDHSDVVFMHRKHVQQRVIQVELLNRVSCLYCVLGMGTRSTFENRLATTQNYSENKNFKDATHFDHRYGYFENGITADACSTAQSLFLPYTRRFRIFSTPLRTSMLCEVTPAQAKHKQARLNLGGAFNQGLQTSHNAVDTAVHALVANGRVREVGGQQRGSHNTQQKNQVQQ